MKASCKYHPTKPAQWYCEECDQYFCPACIDEKRTGPLGKNIKRQCAVCRGPVEWLGVGNSIEPFWNHIPRLFLYALSPWPLALNALLCLGAWFFSGQTMFSWLMQLVFFIVILHYGFSALRLTARGNLVAPPISQESISNDIGAVLKLFVVFMIVFFVVFRIAAFGGMLAGVAAVLSAQYFLPAIIIMFVASQSLIVSLNPARFVPLAFRIGRGYLIMYFFLTLLLGGPAALWYSVLQHLPSGLGAILYNFAGNFYIIVSFHLMGYVLLQYHEEIGYDVEYDDVQKPDQKNRSASAEEKLPARVSVLIKEGRIDEAAACMRTEFGYRDITDYVIAERYAELLLLLNRTDWLLERGRELFDVLLKHKRKQTACSLYLALAATDDGFVPDAAALHRVGGWLAEDGKVREALGAYGIFAKKYPEHELVPMVFFAVARLYNEKLDNAQKSREIMAWLEKKYPHHELMPHVQSYRTRLKA